MIRREVLAGVAAVAASPAMAMHKETKGSAMYGLIGTMRAAPGKRGELVDILVKGTQSMPGCLSYVIALDSADADTIWVSEAWESKTAHERSLSLPQVQAAIRQGRPLIAGMQSVAETQPVGGKGLVR